MCQYKEKTLFFSMTATRATTEQQFKLCFSLQWLQCCNLAIQQSGNLAIQQSLQSRQYLLAIQAILILAIQAILALATGTGNMAIILAILPSCVLGVGGKIEDR